MQVIFLRSFFITTLKNQIRQKVKGCKIGDGNETSEEAMKIAFLRSFFTVTPRPKRQKTKVVK